MPAEPDTNQQRASIGWQFWIDRGGTFTDVIAQTPSGELIVHKLLSQDPEHYADAAVAGMARILHDHTDANHKAAPIDAIKMGTTVATNALLERDGEPTLLAITRGFGDALRIGYQNRPEIFALQIVLPEQLNAAVVEIDERLDAAGQVLVPPDPVRVERE